MNTNATPFEDRLARVSAGEALAASDLEQLTSATDILELGMLADAVRRAVNGTRVTYIRVSSCTLGQPWGEVPDAAREVRILGVPSTLEAALDSVSRARTVAGERPVSGFSWPDVVRLGGLEGGSVLRVLEQLRHGGLESLAEIPMDGEDLAGALDALSAAGYGHLRLTIEKAPAATRVAMFKAAAALRDRYPNIQAINPLPTVLNAFRPTTGYEDVKMVAIARLAAPNVPSIQVDWLRYGPKLAQVALTFGADDFDNVSASDEAPDGRRRAPIEEVRGNVAAAGFSAVERDGRYATLS